VETATVDGITSTSSSESAEQIVASLTDTPVESPASETPEAPAAEPKPKKSSYQARIDELTAELANRKQADSAVNEQATKIAALEREIAALKAPKAPPVERPAPVEDTEPTEDQFESYKDFVKAQAQWVFRQERKGWEREQSQREQSQTAAQREAQIHAKFSERLDAARTTIPNFDAVLASPLPLSRPMQDVIRQSELGPQLMAHLHEHPEEHARIYGAGAPLEVFRQMNKLEARLEAAVSSGPAPKAKPISHAKPPIKPLGAASSVVSDGPPGDDASAEEHFRYWDAKEAESRRLGR